jgi:hypothetical protein
MRLNNRQEDVEAEQGWVTRQAAYWAHVFGEVANRASQGKIGILLRDLSLCQRPYKLLAVWWCCHIFQKVGTSSSWHLRIRAEIVLYLPACLPGAGVTLRENNLKEVEGGTIMESEGILVANRKSLIERPGLLMVREGGVGNAQLVEKSGCRLGSMVAMGTLMLVLCMWLALQ